MLAFHTKYNIQNTIYIFMISSVAQIKERLNIVDVISQYVKLDKAGIHFKAKCPFHNEKSPSFFVSPTRGSYHCFGCARGGDIFSFVQEIEGLDFPETLKLLAEKAGVKLDKSGGHEREVEISMSHVMELSARFYEEELKKNNDVIEYLKKRGVTGMTAKKFRIGYAPDGWSNLTSYLHSKRIPDDLAEKAGLLIKSEKAGGGVYDRFRGRIMFPISNSAGKVVAFSGRIFPPTEDKTVGKYVNSPETQLYNKSSILYGFNLAKQAIMKENSCVIVEGQMDLVMANQAGTENSVAVSGTALTDKHLKLIKRFTDKLIFAFDGDRAGLSASIRGVKLALEEGMDVMVLPLPQGSDPADLILKDQNLWTTAQKNTRPLIEYYIDTIRKEGMDEKEFRREVTKEVLPLINNISSSIEKAHFIKITAEALKVPEDAVREELAKIPKNKENVVISDVAPPAFRSYLEIIEGRIFGGYLWQKIDDLPEKYKKITETNLEDRLNKISDEEKNGMILEAEITYGEKKEWEKELPELLVSLEKEVLDKKFEKLLYELKISERENNTEKVIVIMSECQKISRRIEELKSNR